MHHFVFKCSRSGLLVQGGVEKDKLPEPSILVSHACPACSGVHIVDPHRSERPRPPTPPAPE